jgi:hypothetical protein
LKPPKSTKSQAVSGNLPMPSHARQLHPTFDGGTLPSTVGDSWLINETITVVSRNIN